VAALLAAQWFATSLLVGRAREAAIGSSTDTVNRIARAVEASLNRQKGSRGPDQWLPPANRCEYIARFIRVVRIWGLELSPREQSEYDRLLASCRQGSR
jgi:hypothetical protein